MRLVEYTQSRFDALRALVERLTPESTLSHRAFVDWYYGSNEECRLFLCLDPDERVVGTLGVERMVFSTPDGPIFIGNPSNFNSTMPGVGGHLFLRWLKTCDVGIVFGGSPDTQRIIRQQRWRYCSSVDTLRFGLPTTAWHGEAAWKAVLKRILRRLTPRADFRKRMGRLPASWVDGIGVREEYAYSEDLLPQRSTFSFRFTPSVEQLRWRYDLSLPFIKYRLFRILDEGRSTGYAIFGITRDQIYLSHCDCEDSQLLAAAILLAIAEVQATIPRALPVLLACSHPHSRRVYEQFGFSLAPVQRLFALGPPKKADQITTDPSSWLVSFDWGDNGLRKPFADQQHS